LTQTSRTSALPWLGLALLLAVQYGLFRQYVEREVAWCYPRNHDQTVYLTRSYKGYEHVLSEGPWRGVWSILRQPVPNGMVFEAQAALLYLVLGPSRLSALTVHFAYFALFQIALAGALRRRSGRWGPAFLGVGLLLAAATPYFWAGGIADFRIDFCAFCLYGVFVCVVLRGDVFASWRWSLAAGAVAAWLVYTRYLTAVYIAGITACCLGLMLPVMALRRNRGSLPQGGRRLAGLFAAGAVLTALFAPVVWWKWAGIRDYYLGQFARGEGPVRAAEIGVAGWKSQLYFYLRSLAFDHAGVLFLELATCCLLLALVWRLTWRVMGWSRSGGRTRPDLFGPVFVLVSLLSPLATLTLFGAGSPVVGGIMVGPLLWLILMAVLALLPRGARADHLVAGLAAAVVGLGLYNQASAMARPLAPRDRRAQFEQVSRLCERIGYFSQRCGWSSPRLAFTTLSDSLFAPVIEAEVYERRGVLLNPQTLLGRGIMDVSEADAVAAVRASDFVVMNLTDMGLEVYPFVRCMREYRPHLLAACREGHVAVERFCLPGGDVMLFVRPSVGVEGSAADHWVTERGLTLSVDGTLLRERPRIELRGRDDFAALGKPPAVRAELKAHGHCPRPLTARLTASGAEYLLTVEVQPGDVPEGADVSVELRFDSYFIPAERMANNSDKRHLVMRAPDVVTLIPAP
jgi:hypothetical protein